MPRGVYKHKKGWKHSEATKKKIGEANKGQVPWIKGKHLSDATKEKIRKGKKGTPATSGSFKKGHPCLNFGENHKPEFHTQATKDKIRRARLKQKLPTTDTSIELKVKGYLDRNKIKYIHPFNLKDKFQCDFYLPLSNLIVECDGEYWHSREDMKKRDKAKNAYAKKCGFNILRLTEGEINKGRFHQLGIE